MLCERTGALLKVIPVLEDGTLDQNAFLNLLESSKIKLLAITHVSNALGTINPVKKMAAAAKDAGALVLIDGAQSAPHIPIDMQELDCDFFTFSGHKTYGPTGIGILYGKEAILDELPPWRGGGEMIKEVTFEKTTYNELPFKFEAGTPDIEGGIALAKALSYMKTLGVSNISTHEHILTTQATQLFQEINKLNILGNTDNKAGVISFIVDGIHHYDLGTLLDQMGIAVRTGHHCCQPLMARFNTTGTTRISFAAYNTASEVEQSAVALAKAISMLS